MCVTRAGLLIMATAAQAGCACSLREGWQQPLATVENHQRLWINLPRKPSTRSACYRRRVRLRWSELIMRRGPGCRGSGSGPVDSPVFLPQMVVPVGGEVAVADEGAELEDGFGASQAPSRACDVEAVGDYMAACSFNDVGRLARGGRRLRLPPRHNLPRTAQLTATRGRPTRPRAPGPAAAGKWLTASVTDDTPAVIAAGFSKAERRRRHTSRPGSRWRTATTSRSKQSRPKPPAAVSKSTSSATSSTSPNTSWR